MFVYKITLKQQILLLGPMFLTLVGVIVLLKYASDLPLNSSAFFIVLSVMFLIDTLPTIILHIQYLIKNSGTALTINTTKCVITYTQKGHRYNYCFDDIEALHYYREYGKGSGWHSFGMYRYYKIIFKDGNILIVTCLMVNNIENTLESILRLDSQKHFKLLCLIGE